MISYSSPYSSTKMLRLPISRLPRPFGALRKSKSFGSSNGFVAPSRAFSTANTSDNSVSKDNRVSTWKSFQNALFNRPAIELVSKMDGDMMTLFVASVKTGVNNEAMKVGALVHCPKYKKDALILMAYPKPRIPFVSGVNVRIPRSNYFKETTQMVMEKYLIGCDENLSVGKPVAIFKRSPHPLKYPLFYHKYIEDSFVGEGVLKLLTIVCYVALVFMGAFAIIVAIFYFLLALMIFFR